MTHTTHRKKPVKAASEVSPQAPKAMPTEVLTTKAAHESFAKKYKYRSRDDDGSNETADKVSSFLWAVEAVVSQKQSFFRSDIQQYIQHVNLNVSEFNLLFSAWTEHMESLNKLSKIDGCYDGNPVFIYV